MNNATNTNIFPYLERLLEGETVEWKTIGEVCDIVKAASKLKSGDYCVSGKVPIIDQGAQYIAGYTDKELATIPKDEYIIFGDHTETIKFVDFEFVQGADGLKILHTQKALSKYVYYAFSNFYKKTASYKRHWSKAKETSIPIPPLRVQARIVEILDKFTQLEARKKQYAYYRDQLLNFSQCPPLNANIEWKTLGEVCSILRGRRLTKKQLSEEGKYPVFHGGLEPIGYYDESNRKGDTTMVINVGASAGTIGYSQNDFWSSDGCFCISDTPLALSRFIFYVLQSKELQIKGKVRKAGIPTLDSNILEQLPIPLPPLSEQRRIVDILDRFDTLTNSISEGLPKEIALRRKQYEYYRDALLSFPRPEATV